MDVSIIIVNYNTAELLKQTVQSVIDSTQNIDYEIIVVDNASVDNSVEMIKLNYPQVKLIKNSENLGFSKANNVGMECAIGRYILLLNSDTVVNEGCIENCIDFADKNHKIGALGCKIVLRDGKLDVACKRSFPVPENSFYHAIKLDKMFPHSTRFATYNLTYLDENKIHFIDCVMGAFMLVRSEAIKQVGKLDEDFFMYGEDIDWCYRIKNAGWDICYYPMGEIVHYKKASGKRNVKVIKAFYDAMILFYKKHYIKNYSVMTTFLVYAGVNVLKILALFKNIFKNR